MFNKSILIKNLQKDIDKQGDLIGKEAKVIKELRNNSITPASSISTGDSSNSTNNTSNNAIGRRTVKSDALSKTVDMTHKVNASNANRILGEIGMSMASNSNPKDTKRNYGNKKQVHIKKHYKNTGLNPQNNPFLNPNARTPKSSGSCM